LKWPLAGVCHSFSNHSVLTELHWSVTGCNALGSLCGGAVLGCMNFKSSLHHHMAVAWVTWLHRDANKISHDITEPIRC